MGVSSRWLTAGALVVALAALALVVAFILPAGAPGTGSIATATAGASDEAGGSPATPLPSRAALPEIPAGQANDLDWHEIPAAFEASDARYSSLTAVGDRLLVDGWDDEGLPVVRISDSGAATWIDSWREAEIGQSPTWGTIPQQGGFWEIAGTPELLAATGWRMPAGPQGPREWAAWTSTDGGEHWAPLPAGTGPEAKALLWTGSEFVAFNDDEPRRLDVWTSSDGIHWRRVAGQSPLGTHRAHPELATYGGRIVALLREEESNPYEIWFSDSPEHWARAMRDGQPLRAVAVQSGPYGFVAIDRSGENPARVDVLRSLDGETWTREAIRLEKFGGWQDRCCFWWLADGPDGLVINARGGPTINFDLTEFSWFVPHGEWRADWIGGFDGTIWQGDAYFALRRPCAQGAVLARFGARETGRANPDLGVCISGLDSIIVGLPILQDPATISGTWFGDQCSYLQEPGGHLWEIHWPDGYHIGYIDETPESWPEDYAIVLHGPDGSVVSPHDGQVTLRGGRIEGGEGCAGGVPYGVTDILEAAPDG